MGHEFSGDGEWFTYVNSPASVFRIGGIGTNSKVQIQTDQGYEFFLARFYSYFTFGEGASGTPYVRIREGSGRVWTDDYVNAAALSTQSLPDWWRIPPGKDIIIDLAMVDFSGSEEVTVQYFFEGFRRRLR